MVSRSTCSRSPSRNSSTRFKGPRSRSNGRVTRGRRAAIESQRVKGEREPVLPIAEPEQLDPVQGTAVEIERLLHAVAQKGHQLLLVFKGDGLLMNRRTAGGGDRRGG